MKFCNTYYSILLRFIRLYHSAVPHYVLEKWDREVRIPDHKSVLYKKYAVPIVKNEQNEKFFKCLQIAESS